MLNYRGGAQAFEVFSLLDVLNDQVAPDQFRGKIVLIGVSDPAAHDIWPTPRGMIPGTQVVAHGIDSLLNGIAIRHEEYAIDLLIFALAGAGATWWLGRVRLTLILAWSAALLTMLFIAETIVFARWGVWLNLVFHALTLLMSSLWTLQRRLRGLSGSTR
jgi:CHASE2 domain-containing sensor protein